MKKINFINYKNKMEQKYKDVIDDINNKLLSTDSWSRGSLLHEILKDTNTPLELKYYIFCDWWTSIDSHHDNFENDDIEHWLCMAGVNILEDVKKLNIDEEGYLIVYRGVNEYSSETWEGKSWTIDKEVARRFANGCGIRRQTKYPTILTGKVEIDYIFATFFNRKESEILCGWVDGIESEELF